MTAWIRVSDGVLERLLASSHPAAGAEVMGTGIVSVALSLDGQETLSRILLVLAAMMWVTLVASVATRAKRDRARLIADVRTPAALSSVAGTAVLGTRLSQLGWTWAGIAALAIALLLWLALLGPVLAGWRTPTVGASLMLTVSTESLAVLAATLAVPARAPWLLIPALAPSALGLCFYVFVIRYFDWRQLGLGRGDHWITGGALAISTLTAGKILAGAETLVTLGDGGGTLEALAVGLWIMTMLWLPLLLLCEALRPRLAYDVRRWATVFPLGMYAACSFVVGRSAHLGAITSFGQAWVWVALVVWTLVFLAMIRRAAAVVRGNRDD
jgi:tellurite resistance protein TehA-like permease